MWVTHTAFTIPWLVRDTNTYGAFLNRSQRFARKKQDNISASNVGIPHRVSKPLLRVLSRGRLNSHRAVHDTRCGGTTTSWRR